MICNYITSPFKFQQLRDTTNIFVERLWRTVKYEDVYLKNYDRPADARKGLDEYLHYYNDRRYHSSLGYQTPSEVYFQS